MSSPSIALLGERGVWKAHKGPLDIFFVPADDQEFQSPCSNYTSLYIHGFLDLKTHLRDNAGGGMVRRIVSVT